LIPIWIIIRIASFRANKANGTEFLLKREIVLSVFFIYILCLIGVTLLPMRIVFDGNNHWFSVNLIPVIGTVKEVIKTTTDPNMHDYMMIRFWVKNILGNAVLLLPLGVMMPTLWNKYNSMVKITTIAFCVSLSIEIIQLASVYFGNFGRAFDIDDILLNTVGASIGFIFYKMFIEEKTSFLLHNKKRRRAC
jgi:glycopeptide antibiotics resistance protein